jgi:hypothetical protein
MDVMLWGHLLLPSLVSYNSVRVSQLISGSTSFRFHHLLLTILLGSAILHQLSVTVKNT